MWGVTYIGMCWVWVLWNRHHASLPALEPCMHTAPAVLHAGLSWPVADPCCSTCCSWLDWYCMLLILWYALIRLHAGYLAVVAKARLPQDAHIGRECCRLRNHALLAPGSMQPAEMMGELVFVPMLALTSPLSRWCKGAWLYETAAAATA